MSILDIEHLLTDYPAIPFDCEAYNAFEGVNRARSYEPVRLLAVSGARILVAQDHWAGWTRRRFWLEASNDTDASK